MALLGNSKRGSNKKASNELRKLRRQDLLELLVEQLREGERLQGTIAEQEQSITTLSDLSERLKGKLDDKDVQIEHLKSKLDDKDTLIDRLKARLDEKDEALAKLFEGIRELTEREASVPHAALLHLEEVAADYYLRQFAREESSAAEPPAEEPTVEEVVEETAASEELLEESEEEAVSEEVEAPEQTEEATDIEVASEADDDEGEAES